MWVEVKKAKSLMLAEMWKEHFVAEGSASPILPTSGMPIGQELAEYSILVPKDKEHVIKDVLRKL